jgi:hypothetical protein
MENEAGGWGKLVNWQDYKKMLDTKLPRTERQEKKPKSNKIKEVDEVKIEQKLINNHLSEHYLDIGGWKAKNFLDIQDIKNAKPTITPYMQIPVQKFEFETMSLPDSIFNPKTIEKPPEEELEESKDRPLTLNDLINSVAPEPPKPSPQEIKLQSMIDKMNEKTFESDDERLAKLRARNHKVYMMVDQLLKKPDKSKSIRYKVALPKK